MAKRMGEAMIRKGRQAEVGYCKQGKTLAPVAANPGRPLSGVVLDGKEHLRAVKDAVVTTVAPESCEKNAGALRGLQMKKAVPVSADVPFLEEKVPERMVCKPVKCKNVKKDVTLKTLFHIQKG